MKSTLLVLSLILCGCTTVESGADHVRDFAKAHPVITTIAVGAAAGSIAAVIVANNHHHDRTVIINHIMCEKGVTACGL